LYTPTDGQQTGNNFVDSNKQHVDVEGNMLPGNMLSGVNEALVLLSSYHICIRSTKSTAASRIRQFTPSVARQFVIARRR